MRRRALIVRLALSLAGAWSCAASHPRALASPSISPTLAPPAPSATAPNPALDWTVVAPLDLPLPLGDVGALRGDAAIVIAHDALYRVEADHITPVCAEFEPPPQAIRVDGDRMLAIGADSSGVVVWRSLDRGTTCTRVRLPSMLVRNSPIVDASPMLSLDESIAIAWNDAGAIAYSEDFAATWRRLPDLAGVVTAHRASNRSIVAAVRAGANPIDGEPRPTRAELLLLYRLTDPSAVGWDELSVAPDRRGSIEMRRLPDGDVLLADALGVARLAPDGTVRRSLVEPAYHALDHGAAVIVPAGAGRFVAASREGPLVAIDETGVHPFAPFDPGGHFAIDANADGVVWLARQHALWRGHVGAPQFEIQTHGPPIRGDVTNLAVNGPHLAMLAGGTSVAHSDDGGRTWSALTLPAATQARAMAIGRDGAVLVLTRAAILVSDGPAFVPAALPSQNATYYADGATVSVTGERWIVVDGAVLTTDDQGTHWSTHAPGGDGTFVVASVLRAEAGLFLDNRGMLWRTDDAGSTFAPVGPVEPLRNTRELPSQAHLAWDGGQRVAIVARSRIMRSIDGGASWSAAAMPRNRTMVDEIMLLPDGSLAALVEVEPQDRCTDVATTAAPRRDRIVAVEDASGLLQPARGACEHASAAVTLEGTTLHVASRFGTIQRVDLSRLGPGR